MIADSLDSLAYLCAIVKAGDEKKIKKPTFTDGIQKLRGKVAPTWHFSIDEKDPEFVAFEPKRRDTEFWRYVGSMSIPDSLQHRIEAFASCGALLQFDAESFKPESWLTMYNGFAVQQDSYDSRVNDIDIPRMLGALEVIRSSVQRAAESAMPHAEFVAKFCPAPTDAP